MEGLLLSDELRPRAMPSFIEGFNRGTREYQLNKVIGSGGEAIVYSGYRVNERDRTVAVKISPAGNREQADRLRDEADMIRSIHDHPGIVKVHWHSRYKEVLRSGAFNQHRILREYPFVVTDYMDGGTVEACMRRTFLPTQDIVSVVGQVLSALSWAHGEGRPGQPGIIHRDIKPSNVLFTSREPVPALLGFPDLSSTMCAKVSDLGIAIDAPGRKIDGREVTITATQIAMGTFHYMPPEQIYENAKPQSDDYAVAVMAYRLMTGTFPVMVEGYQFMNPNERVIRWLIKAEDDTSIIPPEEANPERMDKVLEAMQEPIMKSLRSRPENRYSKTGDFLEAVRQAVQRGLSAHRRATRHIDLAPEPGQQIWPSLPSMALTGPVLQNVMAAWTTEGVTEATSITPSDTRKKVSRRALLAASVAVVGSGATTFALMKREAPEARSEQQIVMDVAKQMVQAMEARNLTRRTPFLLKHLIPYDAAYVFEKALDMQLADISDAAWLGAELARYAPLDAARMVDAYREKEKYTEMAIVASALAIAIEAAPSIPTSAPDTVYRPAAQSVSAAIAACSEPALFQTRNTIQAATKKGTFEPSGFSTTTSEEILRYLEDAELFDNVRALGTALAPVRTAAIGSLTAHYDDRVQIANDIEDQLYPLLWRLSAAIAPYDPKLAGKELLRMGDRRSGVADETAWTLAIEVAPYNPDDVLSYITAHPHEPTGAHLAAVALAGSEPAKARELMSTASELVRVWINAALNLTDGHSATAAVEQFTSDPDTDRLDTLGAELTAALLLSRKPT